MVESVTLNKTEYMIGKNAMARMMIIAGRTM
jgi:hypothetical protein